MANVVTGALRSEGEGEEGGEEPVSRAVDSSMVAEVSWEPEGEVIEVQFVNGRSESYPGSREQFDELVSAPSVGVWMHANLL